MSEGRETHKVSGFPDARNGINRVLFPGRRPEIRLLYLYSWRKPHLVFISSAFILVGFFFLLSAPHFRDFPTSKRALYDFRQNDEIEMHSRRIKYIRPLIPIHRSISHTSFRFVINEPHFCLEQKYLYLIAISSSPADIEKRITIRNTWGNHLILNDTRGAIVFLIGKVPNNRRLEKQISEESMSYRDIIQGNFIDSSRHSTPKSVMALKWFSSYCSKVRFLMMTDDDVFVNTKQLAQYLRQKQTQRRWMVGCVQTHSMLKKGNNVLSLPFTQTPFLAGAGYVMSSDIVEPLYEKTQQLRLLPEDDVFVTGHCAKAIGVHPQHNLRFSCGQKLKDYCLLTNSMMTGYKITVERQEKIWDLIKDSDVCNISNVEM